MLSVQRRSLRRSSAGLFWFSSDTDINHATPFSSDIDCSHASGAGDDHDADSVAAPTMPSVHSQLLSDEDVSSEALKGHDHTRDEPSWRRRELSVETQHWLLASFGEDVLTTTLPGLVPASSGASLGYSDDDESSTGTAASDDDVVQPSRARGVSFAPAVTVRPIPHSSALSPGQRGRMFATSSEVRRNKARNKKEFLYDRCDWRNATEERDMDVSPMTGEEVHPAHRYLGR